MRCAEISAAGCTGGDAGGDAATPRSMWQLCTPRGVCMACAALSPCLCRAACATCLSVIPAAQIRRMRTWARWSMHAFALPLLMPDTRSDA